MIKTLLCIHLFTLEKLQHYLSHQTSITHRFPCEMRPTSMDQGGKRKEEYLLTLNKNNKAR